MSSSRCFRLRASRHLKGLIHKRNRLHSSLPCTQPSWRLWSRRGTRKAWRASAAKWRHFVRNAGCSPACLACGWQGEHRSACHVSRHRPKHFRNVYLHEGFRASIRGETPAWSNLGRLCLTAGRGRRVAGDAHGAADEAAPLPPSSPHASKRRNAAKISFWPSRLVHPIDCSTLWLNSALVSKRSAPNIRRVSGSTDGAGVRRGGRLLEVRRSFCSLLLGRPLDLGRDDIHRRLSSPGCPPIAPNG